MKPTCELVMVTPAMASEMLESQTANRNLRQTKVMRLVGLLKSGRWYSGVGTVVFDEDGVMIDGQHRLNAIIHAGIAAEVFVVRGVDPDAKYWIDTGARRTGADALRMAGADSEEGSTATALTLLLKYIKGGHTNTLWHPENEDLRDALEAHPDIAESVDATKGARTSAIHGSHGVFAFLHYLFSRQNQERADEFFRGVLHGLGIVSEGDPRHLLRMRLLDEATRKSKMHNTYVVKLAFKAWILFLGDEERQLLRVRTSGPAQEGWPDIGPVPGVREEGPIS